MGKRCIAFMLSLLLAATSSPGFISAASGPVAPAAQLIGLNIGANSVELSTGAQKIVFTKNGAEYDYATYTTSDAGATWNALFDAGLPFITGGGFDVKPTGYAVNADTAVEKKVTFTAETAAGHAFSFEVSVNVKDGFIKIRISTAGEGDFTVSSNFSIGFGIRTADVAFTMDQAPLSIYNGNVFGMGGLPAAYIYGKGQEAVAFFNMSPAEWQNRALVNGFMGSKVQLADKGGGAGILGLDVYGRTGNRIPADNFVTEFYLYSAPCAAQRSGLDTIDKIVRTCAPLLPSTAAIPVNRDGGPTTWTYFAGNTVEELLTPDIHVLLPSDMQDPLVPEDDRAPYFNASKGRQNAGSGFDFSTTNNWLSPMILYNRLHPDPAVSEFVKSKIDGLAFFYDPKAGIIRWGTRAYNRIADLEMAWQNYFFNIETLRAGDAAGDSDFHPAIKANVLDGVRELTRMVNVQDFLVSQWFDPYSKMPAIQADVSSLGYVREPWQMGSYIYILVKAYEADPDAAYLGWAEEALDIFFSSGYTMTNDVYSRTYADPSQYPVTELFGNAYGAAACEMLYKQSGVAKYRTYAKYYLNTLLRLAMWYDDNKDAAGRTFNSQGLFTPHGGAYNPCSWENVDAYLPISYILRESDDPEIISLLAKMLNLSRVNSFNFYPPTWADNFSSSAAYKDKLFRYIPTEPMYTHEGGGNSDYGALYMASLGLYNYQLYEALALSSNQDVMMLSTDILDNANNAYACAERSFILYNPLDTPASTVVAYQAVLPGSYEYSESAMDGTPLASLTVSGTALGAGLPYSLAPGEIRRIAITNKDDAVKQAAKLNADVRNKLSIAYYRVRRLEQSAFAAVLDRLFKDLSDSQIAELARYVGSLTTYDNAVSAAWDAHVGNIGNVYKYLADAFNMREQASATPDAWLELPGDVRAFEAALNGAMAKFREGALGAAGAAADKLLSDIESAYGADEFAIHIRKPTLKEGESVQLKAYVKNGYNSAEPRPGAVAYSSSNPGGISVTADGMATALVAGASAVITASAVVNGAACADSVTLAVSVPPSGLAVDTSGNDPVLAWAAGDFVITPVGGYAVYRNGQAIARVDDQTLTYTDAGVYEEGRYEYSVRAFIPGDMTLDSNTVVVNAPDHPDARQFVRFDFNEGQGGMAHDPASGAAIGPIPAGAWVSPGTGTGLRFDGGLGLSADLGGVPGRPAGNYTMMAFFKAPKGAAPGSNRLLMRYGGNALAISGAGKLGLYAGGAASPGWLYPDLNGIALPPLDNNKWHMAGYTYENGIISFFVDGAVAGSMQGGAPLGPSGMLDLGIMDGSCNFVGVLGGVRLFNYPLSGKRIAAIYDKWSQPTYHWSFDEGAGSQAADSRSGVTFKNLDCSWENGIRGSKSLTLPGGSGSTAALNGDLLSGAYSVSLFVKTTGTDQFLFGKGDTEFIISNAGYLGLYTGASEAPSWMYPNISGISVPKLNDGKWHMAGYTYRDQVTTFFVDGEVIGAMPGANGLGTSDLVRIGQNGGAWASLNGSIDDLRLYDYVLDPEQIAAIYDEFWGPPVYHWTFEEGAGTQATDVRSGVTFENINGAWSTSGNGNTALTLPGGAGATARLNGDLLSDAYTISVFVKTSGTDQFLFGKGNTEFIVSNVGLLGIYAGASSSPDWLYPNLSGISVPRINNNEWHMVGYTYKDRITTFFVDGAVIGTMNWPNGLGTSDLVRIGQNGGAWASLTGSLDDLRLYNYALDAGQIADIYAKWWERPINIYTITARAMGGGTVSGGGVYGEFATVTLTAAPDAGYSFDGWYEGGAPVAGAGAAYSFAATSNRTLEARFSGSVVKQPVYHWTFDEGSGDRAVDILAGVAFENIGGTWTKGLDGGTALTLPGGTGATASLSGGSLLSGAYSVSLFVKTAGTDQFLFGKGGTEFLVSNVGYLGLYTGASEAPSWMYPNISGISVPKLNDGEWHMVGYTYRDQVTTFFVDGVVLGAMAGANGLGTSDLVRIGQNGGAWASLTGSIDDLRLYDAALDPGQIAAIYEDFINKGCGTGDVALSLSTSAHLVKAGDYFTLNASFAERQDSNAAILELSFDGSKFEYAGFSPAAGVRAVSVSHGDGFARLVLVSMDYDLQNFGDAMLRAKETAVLANEHQTVSASASFVIKRGDGSKAILAAGGEASFTTLQNSTGGGPGIPGDTNFDGVLDLIDLSNMIDWFGITSAHGGWKTLYTFFDFNNNGEIDISDIAYVAKRIG